MLCELLLYDFELQDRTASSCRIPCSTHHPPAGGEGIVEEGEEDDGDDVKLPNPNTDTKKDSSILNLVPPIYADRTATHLGTKEILVQVQSLKYSKPLE
jgi:hypothetical protein